MIRSLPRNENVGKTEHHTFYIGSLRNHEQSRDNRTVDAHYPVIHASYDFMAGEEPTDQLFFFLSNEQFVKTRVWVTRLAVVARSLRLRRLDVLRLAFFFLSLLVALFSWP